MRIAQQPWARLLMAGNGHIAHPPLFYALLKTWMLVGGESLHWLRLLPWLASLAAAAGLCLLGRELSQRPFEIGLALSLCAVNDYLIYHSQWVRMYAWLQCFSVFTLWLFVRFVKAPRQRRWPGVFLLIGNLLLVYTHYWGWVIIGGEVLFVWFCARSRALALVIGLAVLVLAYIPWTVIVLRTVQQTGHLTQEVRWINKPNLFELPYFYATLNGPFAWPHATLASLLLFWTPVIYWLWKPRGIDGAVPQRHIQAFLLLFAFVPVIATFIASRLASQSVWAERELIISAAPYLVLVAAAAGRLPGRWLRAAFIGSLIAWSGSSGFLAMERGHERLSWDELAAKIADSESSTKGVTRVHVFELFVRLPIEYYLDAEAPQRFEVATVSDITDVSMEHFWVVYRDTTWKNSRSPQELLSAHGCRIGRPERVKTSTQTITAFPARRSAAPP